MEINSNATDAVYRKIRQMILDGHLSTDRKIYQNILAQELGVSRTPVIKALHMLEADGLVNNIPQRGFYVHVPTMTEIIELFMIRQGLEMISAMYVAEFSSSEQLDELSMIFEEFEGGGDIDPKRYFEADKAFHCRLLQLCDNSLMHKLDKSMRIYDRSFMVGLLRLPEETLREHLDIIRALRSRDPKGAQEAARAHTEYTKRHLMEMRKTARLLGFESDTLPAREDIKAK